MAEYKAQELANVNAVNVSGAQLLTPDNNKAMVKSSISDNEIGNTNPSMEKTTRSCPGVRESLHRYANPTLK